MFKCCLKMIISKTEINIILLILVSKLLADQKDAFSLKFFQKDYHLIPEWFEVISYNKELVREFKSAVFKHNRTCAALNMTFTFNVDVGNNLDLIGQLFKFASNEYREFPLRMQLNLCQALAADFGGVAQINKCGNFSKCPLVKGRTYHICNWFPDESKLPPYIPSGKYMAEYQGVHLNKEAFVLRAYGSVTRPQMLEK